MVIGYDVKILLLAFDQKGFANAKSTERFDTRRFGVLKSEMNVQRTQFACKCLVGHLISMLISTKLIFNLAYLLSRAFLHLYSGVMVPDSKMSSFKFFSNFYYV